MVGKQQFPDKHSVWINTRHRALALSLDYTQYCSLTHWDAPTHGWVCDWVLHSGTCFFFTSSLSLCTQYYKHDNRASRSPLRVEKAKRSILQFLILLSRLVVRGFSSRRSCGVQFCGSSLTFCVSFSTCVYSCDTNVHLLFAGFRLFAQRLHWTDCHKKKWFVSRFNFSSLSI